MKKITKILILIIVLAGIVAGGWLYIKKKSAKLPYQFVLAEISDISQEVSVTGKIRAAESLTLAFEKSGKIAGVLVGVGDSVFVGQMLIALENSELAAQLSEAEANLEIQEAKLEELKQGTREEEIAVARTKVENSQKSIIDAELNLENVKSKAEVDLEKVYDEAIMAASESVNVGTNAIFTVTDIQYVHFTDYFQESYQIAAMKASAVDALLGGENAGRWTNDFISRLEGGTKEDVKEAVSDPTNEKIDGALFNVKEALQKVKLCLETIPISKLTTTEKTNLSTSKTDINNEVITISGKQQGIEVQKATNQKNIVAAETQINEAKNALTLAEKELVLKEAGSTEEQISVQEAQAKKARASIEYIEAQLSKTIIHSPIKGMVTSVEAKKGEIVSSNQDMVTIDSEADFQIEANVPEADIAKIKIGNEASLTLDAYGEDILFPAKIIEIEPAETIIEGIATYKVIFEFEEEGKEIKSGMTANIDVFAARKEKVLVIPQRALISRDGKKFVRVLEGESIEEVEVETGLRGSDGTVEITKGLEKQDKVITFMEEE